ncbi:hypothetical protein ZL54_22490 [Salmonella enterica subsp. enterica]|nr:hypothetical protein [Salmonella enterica subsp. enterica]EEJ7209107.1 hypothetical protein [Salmonella enterica subsp. enterica]
MYISMTTLAIMVFVVLAAGACLRQFYVEKIRSADRQDEHRRQQQQELEDKLKHQLATFRALAQAAKDYPTDHPVRKLIQQHVWSGSPFWR